MQTFEYERAGSIDGALQSGEIQGSRFLAGGTNLLDLMKGGIEQPERIIDISRLPLATVTELPDGGLRIGAMVRNSDAANHPLVRTRYPLLSQAFLAGASPQLRNMASVGGNLMQRTRCYYFYDTAFPACNKRDPGSGCAARDGYNRIHALFGASDECVATNPSDMSVALAALDAVVEVRGASDTRRIPIADFHRLPGNTPQFDTTLKPGELIVAVELPPSPFAAHAHYLKVRDRASYAFALVSVAAGLDIRDGIVRDARVVLGGVAHKPWRVEAAERAITGKQPGNGAIAAAARASVEGAQPLRHNAFKVELARAAVTEALQKARGRA
ncbi:MAG TPA: xanthine dehydrogenase family protein subunit M [Burkholderiales bacterium]|nr:xanthine dehydrogenase family protein subunit M [Burkholderiales bacterium]